MSQNQTIEAFEEAHLKQEVPSFKVGDTVRVHLRIIEGNKERIQVFEGTVIARKGKGLSETFSVYRNAYGSSMERVFLLHSPRIQKIEVVRAGKVRRAKLYYLRGATGKKAKVRELLGGKKEKVVQEKVEEKVEEEKPDVDETVKNEPELEKLPEEPKEEEKNEKDIKDE